jgi:hypothetical protein
LLHIERGEHDRLVVHFGGVLIDCGRGLSAQIAIARIELECADAMRAAGACELHASLDAGNGVETLHKIECNRCARNGKSRQCRSNVTLVQVERNAARNFKLGLCQKGQSEPAL